MEYTSYSVGIAAIIGLVRIQKIDRAYYPFVFLLVLGIVNEILNTIIINSGHSNAINSNIYILLESLLILSLFAVQGLFINKKFGVFAIAVLYGLTWCIELFFISSIRHFSSYFALLYPFLTVLMSINMINRLLIREKNLMLKHPMFIICFGFILFYTFTCLIEIFWAYGLGSSKEFRVQILSIHPYINLITNIIYIFAALWIPRKQEYTLL